ncbi:MAG: YihY/virulence factor BrkB family protein [Eubacteriales bacterium]|nr:YihY/virulence factor BrkB family protein [Eubacteriales bacterium]
MKNKLMKVLQLAREFGRSLTDHHIAAYAANVSYFVLLSIFPFLLGMSEILRLTAFSNPTFLSELWAWLPSDMSGLIHGIIENLSLNKSKFTLPIAIVAALWSASKGALSLQHGLNIAFRQEPNGNFILKRIFAFLFTVGFMLLIFLSSIVLVFGQYVIDFIEKNIGMDIPDNFILIKDLAPILMLIVMMSLAYYSIVYKEYRFKQIIPGAIFATAGFLLSSWGMTLYIQMSASLSYMYGSLAGVIGLMMWINICSYVILIGAEINAMLKEKLDKKQGKEQS